MSSIVRSSGFLWCAVCGFYFGIHEGFPQKKLRSLHTMQVSTKLFCLLIFGIEMQTVQVLWALLSLHTAQLIYKLDWSPNYKLVTASSFTSSCQTSRRAKGFRISKSQLWSAVDLLLLFSGLFYVSAECFSWVYYSHCRLVFSGTQHPVAGRMAGRTAWVNCAWMRYANHQSCIFISWHLLTFGAFLFIQVLIVQQINTVNIEQD